MLPWRAPRGVALATVVGALILNAGFVLPSRPLPAMSWVVRLADVVIVCGALLVALLGAQDALLRRDGRSLPLAAASVVIATLWSVHFLVWPGLLPPYHLGSSQVITVVFLTGHITTPTVLAIALAARPGHLPRPRLDVFGSLVPVALAAGVLAVAAIALAPQLPALGNDDGSLTLLNRALDALAIPPAAAALVLFAIGRRGDERVAGGIAVAAALVIFNAVGAMLVQARYDAFFYIFNMLRVLPVIALAGAQLGLHRQSIRHEQRRVRDLRLLHDAARAVSSSLDLQETLEHIARATLDLFRLTGVARVAVIRRDHDYIQAVVRLEADGRPSADNPRYTTMSHPLLARVLATGQAATWSLEDLEAAGTVTAPTLRREGYRSFANVPIPGSGEVLGVLGIATQDRRKFDEDSMGLLESLAQLAGLAMANAETFGRLAESESRLRTTFEGSGLPILVQDREGRIAEVNPAACALLGYPREALMGRTASELIHPQDRSRDQQQVASLIEGEGGIERWEKRVLRKDGGSVWVEVTAAPFPGFDDEPAVITMWVDLSERRRAEEAARDSREKSRFLATMSHELRCSATRWRLPFWARATRPTFQPRPGRATL